MPPEPDAPPHEAMDAEALVPETTPPTASPASLAFRDCAAQGDAWPMRLFYFDDSGAVATGWIVYSWVEVAVNHWSHGLRDLLEFRRRVYAEHKIPPAYELHSSPFVGARGNPSQDPDRNRVREHRRQVLQSALHTVGSCPVLSVGTVHRRTTAVGSQFARERAAVYARVVAHLDARLSAAGQKGVLVMDGNGTETAYYDGHRALRLSTRSIIEDPIFVPSHRSQWVQMADVAAWSAYQHLQQDPSKSFAWDWYPTLVGHCDVNGGPIADEDLVL